MELGVRFHLRTGMVNGFMISSNSVTHKRCLADS
jgi:hypothetical protein